MSYFDIKNWYTDEMDVYRITEAASGYTTVQNRQKVGEEIPCRIYAPGKNSPTIRDTAATGRDVEKVACALSVDVQEGDVLYITRGGRLGAINNPERYIAGHPVKYYDPVGGAMTFIEHQEIGLMADNLIGEDIPEEPAAVVGSAVVGSSTVGG